MPSEFVYLLSVTFKNNYKMVIGILGVKVAEKGHPQEEFLHDNFGRCQIGSESVESALRAILQRNSSLRIKNK